MDQPQRHILLMDILYGVALKERIGLTDIHIERLSMDSRENQKGSLFMALRGSMEQSVDGHDYISNAIQAGAIAILCEKIPEEQQEGITYLRVDNSSEALGLIASNFYDNPSSKIKLIGVTGTNGKTTIVTLLFRLFTGLGYYCGLLSTIENRIGKKIIPATHTTPNAISLNALLAEMVAQGCEFAFMEVSSHAVVQNRIFGIEFALGIFTNLSHDHLDYHGSFDNYIAAKKGFFDALPKQAIALINTDDRRGAVMLQNTKATKVGYALKSPADYKAKILESGFGGMLLTIDGHELHVFLIGEFNAYNILSVYAAAILLEQDKLEVLKQLSRLKSADGRFESIRSKKDGVVAIIDYAHTPDALEKVLATIHGIRDAGEKIITVVGCGGDRDKTKRPKMARIACQLSDKVILTSDNPRSENPEAILKDMAEGVGLHHQSKTLSIIDRKEAIRTACMLAEKNDIILIAGKGHEKYQDISGVKHPFDDKEVITETFKSLSK